MIHILHLVAFTAGVYCLLMVRAMNKILSPARVHELLDIAAENGTDPAVPIAVAKGLGIASALAAVGLFYFAICT